MGELYFGGDNEVRAPLTDSHCMLAYGWLCPFYLLNFFQHVEGVFIYLCTFMYAPALLS